MRKKINLIFLFILLVSLMTTGCKKTQKDSEAYPFETFHSFILNNLIYSIEIGEILNPGTIISRPPGLVQLIASFVTPKENSIKNQRLCLYYKIPFKENKGELIITQETPDESCHEDVNVSKLVANLQNVTEFQSNIKNFKYKMNFKYNEENKTLLIPMANLEQGVIHEKYRAKKIKSLYSGLKILKPSDEHFSNKHSPFLGKLSDRFEDGSAIRCVQISQSCKLVGEDLCDRCRYGSYEVVDFTCPQGGSRFCGQNRCGQKNEPACPIGAESITEDLVGICQEDLRPVLNAEKIWICQ